MSERKIIDLDRPNNTDKQEVKLKQDETVQKYVEPLIKYSSYCIKKGKGFVNSTSTMCYHNSLMQCLLSLPSIYKVISNSKKQHFLTNSLKKLWELYYGLNGQEDDTQLNQLNQKIWNAIIEISKQRADKKTFDQGQQDANEGLLLFLSVVEQALPELYVLFEHVYWHIIYCVDCDTQKTVKKKGTIFHVKQSFKTDQHPMFSQFKQPSNLNEYLICHDSYIVSYKCEKCQSIKPKFSINLIRGLPEILPVLFEKYSEKTLTPFPLELYFKSAKPGISLAYKLFAQCEHSGNQGGGHYWAIAERSNGVIRLNDSSISPAVFEPTLNTYMVFYHYIGEVNEINKTAGEA